MRTVCPRARRRAPRDRSHSRCGAPSRRSRCAPSLRERPGSRSIRRKLFEDDRAIPRHRRWRPDRSLRAKALIVVAAVHDDARRLHAAVPRTCILRRAKRATDMLGHLRGPREGLGTLVEVARQALRAPAAQGRERGPPFAEAMAAVAIKERRDVAGYAGPPSCEGALGSAGRTQQPNPGMGDQRSRCAVVCQRNANACELVLGWFLAIPA